MAVIVGSYLSLDPFGFAVDYVLTGLDFFTYIYVFPKVSYVTIKEMLLLLQKFYSQKKLHFSL